MNDVTFITTCKGRLEHVQQTLPMILAENPAQVIVVDYGCPQHVGEWVERAHPSVKVVRVDDDPGFCVARARNIGAQYATSPWLFFIDADVQVRPGLGAWLDANLDSRRYYRASPVDGERDREAWGSFVCTREAFQEIGGYDEAFRGWGGEDDDIYARLLMAKFIEADYPSMYVRTITHDDALRTTYYEEKTREAHLFVNKFYTQAKIDMTNIQGKPMPLENRLALMENVKNNISQWLADGAPEPFTLNIELASPGWLPPPYGMVKKYKLAYYAVRKP